MSLRRRRRVPVIGLLAAGLLLGPLSGAASVISPAAANPAGPVAGATPSVAQAAAAPLVLPSAVPSGATPSVLDGRVSAIAQVGSVIVIGGTFTSVADPGDDAEPVARNYIAAYRADTGALVRRFHPRLDDDVRALAAGSDGHSVYVGGAFKHLGTTEVSTVLQLDVRNGRRVAGFDGGALNGAVNALVYRGTTVYAGGFFTEAGGQSHQGLVALKAADGTVAHRVDVQLSGQHNTTPQAPPAREGVWALDVSPAGDALVAAGNFTKANGLDRDQIVMVRLGRNPGVVRAWATQDYTPVCSPKSFASYMRGVSFSPSGDFFVVVTTGGPFRRNLCDKAARWETAARGTQLHPTWVGSSGGDTFLSVDVSRSAVYVGGHQRFMNNPLEVRGAGPGAVPRAGVAALDPRTGVPLSWNPGRNPRGFGTTALLATDDGVYMGSDTSWVGDHVYRRPRIAFFPNEGGSLLPSEFVPGLPGEVYAFGPLGGGDDPDAVRRTALSAGGSGSSTLVDVGDVDWSSSRGAFMLGKTLWYGWADGTFHRRLLFHDNLGPDRVVDPYHDPVWAGVHTGSGDTYEGEFPDFYAQLPSVSGMYYLKGRLYYSRTGVRQLAWRDFSPESGIVSPVEHLVRGPLNWGTTKGVLRAGTNLYFANAGGALRRVPLVDGLPQAPAQAVAGTETVDWAARGLTLFAGAGAGNLPPVARLGLDCSARTCWTGGSASTDADGIVTDYAWDFDDGTTSTQPDPTHTFAADGTYEVALTVTDDNGDTATASRTVTVDADGGVTMADARSAGGNSSQAALWVPAGAQAGDVVIATVTSSGTDVPPAPSGWTEVDVAQSGPLWTVAWRHVVESGEPGTSEPVPLGSVDKWVTASAAYRGVDQADPVVDSAAFADADDSVHSSPGLSGVAGSWVVVVWSDKSPDTGAWTLPDQVAERAVQVGTGVGRVSVALADSAGPYALANYPTRTASTDVTSARGAALAVALRPAP